MRLGRGQDVRGRMAPEARLVLECCRPGGDAAAIRSLPGPGFDWPRLVALAARDRVVPLVNEALTRHAADLLPAAVATELRRRLFVHAGNALLVTNELVRLMASLAAQGIRALTFKGPALAVAAYGRVSLRMFSDVDVLVDDRDHARCLARLQTEGYTVLRDFAFEQTLRREGSPAMVDLHRSVSPAAFPCALSFDELWARRSRVPIAETEVDCLSPADHLMVLCVQITRDRWESKGSLAKLCDVDRLVQGGGIDWGPVLDQSRALGFERRLLAVLAAAEELLETPLPPPVIRRLDGKDRVRRLGTFISGEFLRDARDSPARLAGRIAFHFRVHERAGHKLAQLRMVPIKLREALLDQR